GQNVAFVLIVVHPVVRWLPWRWRAVVVLAVLGGFTLVTRAEPSVLRAVAMAGFTTLAVATGRPTSGLRHLALAAVA
ncbi:MAG: ComEC/Rec2 family competence protein, partial [Acidimicrobiales bacterium]|nr:ComEC/Rec2 family competence protein [Acidimicrobiales bacterium]